MFLLSFKIETKLWCWKHNIDMYSFINSQILIRLNDLLHR